MSDQETFLGPEPEAMRQVLRDLGRFIKEMMPPGWGFTLLMFTIGERGSLMYLSSADRADMRRAMLEFLEHTEKGPHESDPNSQDC